MEESFYDLAVKFFYGLAEEVSPMDFYRHLFQNGNFHKKGERREDTETKEYLYNPIGMIHRNDRCYRKYIFDGLHEIEELLKLEDFVTLPPVTYVGKERKNENARHLYALAIDLDGVKTLKQLENIWMQATDSKYIYVPCPNYLVLSGNGLHYYYFFDLPYKLNKEALIKLKEYKYFLIEQIWNVRTTDLVKVGDMNAHIQYEPVLQPFRLVGGVTKDYAKTGHRTKAYLIQKEPSDIIERAQRYWKQDLKLDKVCTIPLSVAKEKYPDWFERRIIKGEPKSYKGWTCKEDLYNWWFNKIKVYDEQTGAREGHRYYDIVILTSYAVKCGIPFEKLKEDAMSLLELYRIIPHQPDNDFKISDITSALNLYKNELAHRLSIDGIVKYSGIQIEKNRRNHRKQGAHLKRARFSRDLIYEEKGIKWDDNNGRKSKQDLVKQWRIEHPDGTKYKCCKDLGLSKPTVYKWWDYKG